MIQGTYYKEWSRMLGRDMEFKVYGHAGTPVLALPARGGRFYDWENNGMPDAIAPLLNEGKVQLFCADSIDAESLLAGDTAPRRRAEMQEKYFNYLTGELAPRILALNGAKKDTLLWAVGVDTGAYQAAGFACTQLAFTKAVEGVKSYADVTPALVERARAAAAASGVGIAVDGTYVELSYADEDKRHAEVAKVLSQIPVARALGAGCMGSETTNMAKQPGVTRREAQEALLRSLGEILPACEEQGVLFAVECVYYHAMNTPEAVRMVLDTMASPNLRVICDFANYVGPEAASVDAQRRIWDKVGSWYGDKITAVHFKGQNFQPDGTLYSTSLEDSCVDYAGGFEMLRQMPQASLPVLREEAVPARAASDLAFMRRFAY